MAEDQISQISGIGIFNNTFSALEGAMQAASQRQAIIAHNIANANTPGYRALTFDEALGKAVARAQQPDVVLEQEMSELSRNSLRYSSYVKLMTSKLGVLRGVVSQGRK